jgi:uncharacterized membrane protein HdeD (DUF308 family)
MSVATQLPSTETFPNEAPQIKRRWGHFAVLGLMLIALGALAIVYWSMAAEVAVDTLGSILVAGSIVQVLTSLWANGWRGFFVHLGIGILYAVAGTIMIRHPLAGAEAITLVLALAYVAGGLMRLAFAVSYLSLGTGWVALNGAITFALGLMIWEQWPWASMFILGLFLGIDLMMLGWTWIMLGANMRFRSRIA